MVFRYLTLSGDAFGHRIEKLHVYSRTPSTPHNLLIQHMTFYKMAGVHRWPKNFSRGRARERKRERERDRESARARDREQETERGRMHTQRIEQLRSERARVQERESVRARDREEETERGCRLAQRVEKITHSHGGS